MNLLPYKKSDYSGPFNLLKNEKQLIRKAWIAAQGNLDKMVMLLEIKKLDLLIAIIRHFNVSDLPSGSSLPQTSSTSSRASIRKKHPKASKP